MCSAFPRHRYEAPVGAQGMAWKRLASLLGDGPRCQRGHAADHRASARGIARRLIEVGIGSPAVVVHRKPDHHHY